MNKIIILLVVGMVGCADNRPEDRITIFAAASLREVVEEAARRWERGTGKEVRLQIDGSAVLARQIRAGAGADLFISADSEWAEAVNPMDRYNWIGNRLACVIPRDAETPDLATLESLALGSEEVPVGRYARAALESIGISMPRRIVYGGNVRDVLTKVAEGAAQAGIVYATDAPLDGRIRAAFLLPEESHPPIVYVAALIHPRGRDFYEYLRLPHTLEIPARLGFRSLP